MDELFNRYADVFDHGVRVKTGVAMSDQVVRDQARKIRELEETIAGQQRMLDFRADRMFRLNHKAECKARWAREMVSALQEIAALVGADPNAGNLAEAVPNAVCEELARLRGLRTESEVRVEVKGDDVADELEMRARMHAAATGHPQSETSRAALEGASNAYRNSARVIREGGSR